MDSLLKMEQMQISDSEMRDEDIVDNPPSNIQSHTTAPQIGNGEVIYSRRNSPPPSQEDVEMTDVQPSKEKEKEKETEESGNESEKEEDEENTEGEEKEGSLTHPPPKDEDSQSTPPPQKYVPIHISWFDANNNDLGPSFQKGGLLTRPWNPEELVCDLVDDIMLTFGHYHDLKKGDITLWSIPKKKEITGETWGDLG